MKEVKIFIPINTCHTNYQNKCTILIYSNRSVNNSECQRTLFTIIYKGYLLTDKFNVNILYNVSHIYI